MTGWLNFTRRPSATSRADRSVIPAGGNGTLSRIGRVGNDCAAAAADRRAQPKSAAMRPRSLRRICFVTTGTSSLLTIHELFVVATRGLPVDHESQSSTFQRHPGSLPRLLEIQPRRLCRKYQDFGG